MTATVTTTKIDTIKAPRKPRADKGKPRAAKAPAGVPATVTSIAPAKEPKPPKAAKPKPDKMIDPKYRSKYVVVKNEDGSRTLDNGDPIAKGLRGMTIEGLRAVAATMLGRSQRVLRDEYEHLNPGQQSMTLRNRIRKAYRAEGGAASFEQALKEIG